MGRKSKTKKIVREILEEKAKKGKSSAIFEKLSKPQSKKDLKKQAGRHAQKKTPKKERKAPVAVPVVVPEQKEKAHQKIHRHFKKHKRSILGGLLISIMLALLVCIAYLLFSKAFRPDSVAKLLQADSTVALVEINTNLDHVQIVRSEKLLNSYPQYSQQEIIKRLESALAFSYSVDIKPWLGRSFSVALFNSTEGQNVGLREVYFAEFLNKEELLKFIAAHSTSDKRVYQNYEIYNLNQKYYATIIDQYLAFSLDESSINELIGQQGGGGQPLEASEAYRQIDDNLPLNRVASVYLNFDNIQDSFFQYFPQLGENGLNVKTLAPFTKIFNAQGMALVAEENNFVLQSFTKLHGATVGNFNDAYSPKLASMVKKDAILFWGVGNLASQFESFVGLLAKGDDGVSMVVKRILNNYAKKYFGKTVTIEEGILPILQGEFAFAIEPQKRGGPAYKAVIELKNGKVEALKLQDLAKQFASIGAIFAPKLVEHTLPDGTVTKEIVAVPEEIISSQTVYKDTTIYELKAGNQGWSVFYAFAGNTALIANRADAIKDSVDLIGNPSQSLKIEEELLEHASEVSYVNVGPLLGLVFGKNDPPAVMKILDTISSGNTYVNGGITTTSYLKIK